MKNDEPFDCLLCECIVEAEYKVDHILGHMESCFLDLLKLTKAILEEKERHESSQA